MMGKEGLQVMEGIAKFRVATSVFNKVLSHIKATRLSLSIMKRPLSLLSTGNAVCLNVLESAATTELEEVDEIMRLQLIELPYPLVAIITSVAASIALYSIRLPSFGSPPVVEYYHIELPAVSSIVTVLRLLNQENAYNTDSLRPNVNPRWPELVEPVVFLVQEDVIVVGSNLKKC